MKTDRKDILVGDFYRACGRQYDLPFLPEYMDDYLLRAGLVLEEAQELYKEMANIRFGQGSVDNLLKELGDVLFTAYGFAGTLGVDPDVIFNRVHRSNMTKTIGANKEGKIQKGVNYEAPDFTDLAGALQ